MNSTRQQTQRNSDSTPAGRVPPAARRLGGAKRPGQATMPPSRTWLWLVLVLLANYLLVRLLIPNPDAPITVPYTLFKEEVTKGNVEAIFSRGATITGRFETPVTYPPAGDGDGVPRRAQRGGAQRAPNGEDLHDHAACLRRPRFGSLFDR